MTNDTAQILANCLDVLDQPDMTLEECVRPYVDQAGSLIELLAIAQTLRAAPAVTPSLDFRIDARQRLLARLPVRRSRWDHLVSLIRLRLQRWSVNKIWLMRAAFILLVGVVLGASAVVASAQSLPNDALYPMKRGIEQVRLFLTPDRAAFDVCR